VSVDTGPTDLERACNALIQAAESTGWSIGRVIRNELDNYSGRLAHQAEQAAPVGR